MSDNHFIILITVYNSEKWVGQCIDSAISQNYGNFDVVVIDDHSTDGTWDMIREPCLPFVPIKHRNEIRLGDSLPNTIMALKTYSKNPEDIIVHLDGDDCLYGNNVLNVLNGYCLDAYSKSSNVVAEVSVPVCKNTIDVFVPITLVSTDVTSEVTV